MKSRKPSRRKGKRRTSSDTPLMAPVDLRCPSLPNVITKNEMNDGSTNEEVMVAKKMEKTSPRVTQPTLIQSHEIIAEPVESHSPGSSLESKESSFTPPVVVAPEPIPRPPSPTYQQPALVSEQPSKPPQVRQKVPAGRAKSATQARNVPAPKEVAAKVITAETGVLKQFTSRINIQSNLNSVVSTMQLEEIVPDFVKGYAPAQQNPEERDKSVVLWTKFETYDGVDLLILGYDDGFQVWELSTGTKVKEMVSIKTEFPVRLINFLSMPATTTKKHALDAARPLIGLVSTGMTNSNVVKVFSLAWKSYAHELRFKSRVLGFRSNDKVVVVALEATLFVFDGQSLQHRFKVKTQKSASAVLALNKRWLAFASIHNVQVADSQNELSASWREGLKDIASGVCYLGGLGQKYTQNRRSKSVDTTEQVEAPTAEKTAMSEAIVESPVVEDSASATSSATGTIMIRDLLSNAVVAHFKSHDVGIELLAFDPTGAVLVSAPLGGQNIHVHRILPQGSINGNRDRRISHKLLYRLDRGITQTSIRNTTFSKDLRWIAVSSSRGTCHLYAVSNSGGPVDAVTHPIVHMETTSSSESNSWKELVMSSLSSSFSMSPPNTTSHIAANSTTMPTNAKQFRKKPTDGPVILEAKARVRQTLSYAFTTIEDEVDLASPVAAKFSGPFVLVVSSRGVLEKHELLPYADEKMELHLSALPRYQWDLCRKNGWSEIVDCPMLTSSGQTSLQPRPERRSNVMTEWLSNAEIRTHAAPLTQLWASPQFRFMAYTDESSSNNVPLFVEGVKGRVVKVRGAGPSVVAPKSAVRRAICTPAKFQNLQRASENEIAETVLPLDDDSDDSDEMFLCEPDDDEIFMQDEEIYSDAIKEHKEPKEKEN